MMLAMQQMNAISRRSFLHVSAIGLVGAGYLGANPLGLPIGCQTWPVRQTIGKDLRSEECNFAEKLSPCERDRPGWGRLSRRQSIGLADRVPDVAGQANHREGSRWHTEGTGRYGVREDRDVLAARLRTDGLWAARTDETSAVARQDSRRRAGLRELPLWLHGTEGPSRRAAGIRQGARPETNDYLHVWRAEGRQNGGLDARRRRRQQVRRADAESRHTTRLPDRKSV